MNKIKYTFLILFLLPVICLSQTNDPLLQFNGFIDTYHAMRIEKPNDFISSRTRFRGEISKAFGKSSMFVSFNLNQNSILKELNGLELREAYFDYTSDNWSFRAGRQLIIWGNADGLRITDLFSPMDMTEFLAREYDDIRMPVESFRIQYFNSIMKVELVYVPIFKSFVMPTNPKNPWAIPLPSIPMMNVVMMQEEKPDFSIKNGEVGTSVRFNLSGIDFSLSGLYTWDKMPLIKSVISNDSVLLIPEYNRLSVVGTDFSVPIWQLVVRGEAAFNFNKHFVAKMPNTPSTKHNTLHYLVGVDWYAPRNWMLSLQFSDEIIFKYKNIIQNDQHSYLGTLSISKSVINNTLTFRDFIYTDLKHGGFFNRFSTEYDLTDQIEISVGYDQFYGDEGIFSYFKNNSEVWLKAKYSF